MTQNKTDTHDRWGHYYKATSGREPRRLLIEALPYVKNKNGTALDLGAGDLTESIYLLHQGFSVVALDSSPASESLSKTLESMDFTFVRSAYDLYNFKPDSFDLITAQLALPFNKPETFGAVLKNIKESLKPGGVFAGHFFGTHDEWNTLDSGMSFHDMKDIETMFSDMRIRKLKEEESDKETALGVLKHWHVFEIIATKADT